VAKAFLQQEFAHPAFPHPRGMRVPQSVWRHPRLADAERGAPPLEQPDQRRVAQRLGAFGSMPANQEDERRLSSSRPLIHHVPTDGLERGWLMQIHHALRPRLGTGAFRMIGVVADDHPPTAVLHVI